METVANGHKASDFHQTSINGPKFTQKKRKHSQHTQEVIELILLEIVRIRFAALGGAWITNRLLCLCVRAGMPKRRSFPCTPRVPRFSVFAVFLPFAISQNQDRKSV